MAAPVKPGRSARIEPLPPRRQPRRADPAQPADRAAQARLAQTPKAQRKAGSTVLRILLLPFRICLFIIHAVVLTVGLAAIIGAVGFWWVANHQEEANEMAATALEYVDRNKDRLKPVTDFLGPVFDSLLPPKARPGPGEPEDPPGTPSR